MSVQVHNMEAQAFASSVSSRLGGVQARYGRGEETPYKQIPEALARLEQALDTAISTDEQQASGLWNELKAFIKHGFDYFGEKARFDAEVKALVTAARGALAMVKSVVNGHVVPKIPLPEKLMTVSEHWTGVKQRADQVGEQVPILQHVDGWSGPAYEQYRTMSGVQAEAVKEYSGLPRLLATAYRDAALLNQSVLSMVYSELQAAASSASKCYNAPSGQYYVNTATILRALVQVLVRLQEVVRSADAPAEALGQAVADSQAAAVVIERGWPRGAGQAGQRAGETARDIPTPAVPITSPGPRPDNGPSHGLER